MAHSKQENAPMIASKSVAVERKKTRGRQITIPNDIDPILSVDQVMEICGGVCRRTVYNWLNAGLLTKRFIGGTRVGVLKSEVVAFKNSDVRHPSATRKTSANARAA